MLKRVALSYRSEIKKALLSPIMWNVFYKVRIKDFVGTSFSVLSGSTVSWDFILLYLLKLQAQ